MSRKPAARKKPAAKRAYKPRAYARRPKQVLTLRGYGDYDDWKDDDDRILGNKGSFKNYGGYYGKKLGEFAGNALATLTGFGDYVQPGFKINTNSMLQKSAGGDPPMIVNAKGQNTIIRHREFIKDIVTSATAGAFQLEDFVINPANELLFPWLSRVCSESWQQYRLRGMVVEFKSIAADAIATSGTNNSIGTIIMATNYNSAEPAWVSKIQMENTEFATSAKQCHSMLHPIECAPSQTPLTEMYIGTPGADEDEKTYNWGRFQIASVGNQAASVNIGELWVSYEIELLKPFTSNEPTDNSIQSVHYYTASGTTAASWFGTAAKQGTSSSPIVVSGNSVEFNSAPIGLYLITAQWVTTSATQAFTAPNLGYTRCSSRQYFEGDTAARAYAPGNGTATGRGMVAILVETVGPNAIVSLSGGQAPGTPGCMMDCVVTQINPFIGP